MELTERELLEEVARDRSDAMLSVLADYWIGGGNAAHGTFVQLQCGELAERPELADEEARLSEVARRWRDQLVASGYSERDLMFDRGLLEWPLVVREADVVAPAIFRISPTIYRERTTLTAAVDCDVYAAERMTPMRDRGERVVIKAPHDDDALAVLAREHAILSRLRHPGVIAPLGWATRRGGRALALPWVGVGLDRICRSARQYDCAVPIPVAIAIAVQVYDALAAIHAAGVVHCDVRGDHVLVRADGQVTLIDFGYARAAEPRPQPNRLISPGPRIPRGRFKYMSPEQVRGLQLDGRTDVFSTTMLLCELVLGRHPIADQLNDFETLFAIRDRRWTVPRLPASLEAVVTDGLADQRSRSHAREMHARLVGAAGQRGLDIGPHVIARWLCEYGVPG